MPLEELLQRLRVLWLSLNWFLKCMFYININTAPLLEPFMLSKESVRQVTQSVVEGVSWALYEGIRNQASNSLKSTRQLYLRNLNQPEIGPLTGTITLTGSLPNMIEQGATAFDMKQGILSSAKAKQSKDGGRYMTIPFRFAGAGSLGESEVFSGVLPTEIQTMLNKMKSARTSIGGAKESGQGLNVKGTKFGKVMTRGAFSELKTRSVFGSYTHKSPIYQGLTRSSTVYEKAMQSQYTSFRRVSSNSSKNSWIHPGMTAKNFFDRAYQEMNVDTLVGNLLDEQLEILGL